VSTDRLRNAAGQATRLSYRFVAVGVVVTLAYYLGRRPSPLWIALLAGVCLVAILLRRPELGLLGVLVSALIVPFSLGTGTQTRLHAALLLIPMLAALWLADMVMRRDVRLVPSPTNLPLLLFVLSATVSLLAGSLPWIYFAARAPITAQVGGWAVFVLSATIFLLAANQIKDMRWLQALVWLFLAVGGVVLLGRLLPPLGAVSGRLVQASAVGSLFWVWLVALAGGQALLNDDLQPRYRGVLAVLAVLTVLVNFFQDRGWASGWLPSLVAIGAVIWLRSWRLGLAATVLGLVAVGLYAPDLPAALIRGDQYSVFTRQVAWQIILGQVVKANPIIGLGPANYYHYTPLFPILGWYVRFNSHNQYVDIIAQVGLVGMAIFVWLMAAIALVGFRVKRAASDGFSRAYAGACLAGLAGSLAAGWLADWFLPFVYNIGLAGMRASLLGWLFLGGLVAVKHIVEVRAGSGEA
jgi:O-antigen ligase